MGNMSYQRKRDFSVCNIVDVCATTRQELVNEIMSIEMQTGSATVCLIGVPGVISASESEEVAQVYKNATVAAIDGMPIVKMGRRRGFTCERCAAQNIMPLIFEESVKRGKKHFFYGGKNDETLHKLTENIEKMYPGIKIVGMYSPPYRPLSEEENSSIIAEINKLEPDIIWVGIGAPKQELWMEKNRNKINGAVMLGVGAGFNYFAGELDIAPEWIQEASFEWLFRLVREPRRLWKRYVLGGFKWIYLCIKSKMNII